MIDSTYDSIINRQKKLLRVVIYLSIVSCFMFSLSNFVFGRSNLIVLYNLLFGLIYIPLLFFIDKFYLFTLILLGVLFHAFIFGHSYYLLPGKQIEAGFALVISLAPIFATGKRLWATLIVNIILYHIAVFNAGYQKVFVGQYFFYFVIFLIVKMLVDKNTKIEEQLLERNKRISTDAQKLIKADYYKTRFFTNITHEFRTPLTLILAPLDNILEGIKDSRMKKHLQLVQKNSRSLLKRVNELLEFSKNDQHNSQINLHTVDLCSFLSILFDNFKVQAQIKGIDLKQVLDLKGETYYAIDKSKIEMIVSNLISNAIKFTHKNGSVSISVSSSKTVIKIVVSDNGPGVIDKEKEAIFERFYQIATQDYSEGSGIGLALAKELTEVINGSLVIEDNMPTGSKFILEFPAYLADNITDNDQEYISSSTPVVIPKVDIDFDANRPKVLIVEDNLDMQTYLASLYNEDYEVISLSNGQEASDFLISCNNEELPILILTDIMMPVMNGIDFLKFVKSNAAFRLIPTIVLTAVNNPSFMVDILRIGIDDYLTKPFNNQELITRSLNLINNYYLRRKSTQDITQLENITIENQADEENHDQITWLKMVENKVKDKIGDPKFKMIDLAADLNISTRSLQTKIKSLTGLTPKKYQREIVLSYAKDQIISQQIMTVSELSYKIGFEDPHYFSTIYRRHFGISPSDEIKKTEK